MGEIPSKRCEGRELTKDQLAGRFVTDTAAGAGLIGDLHSGIAVVPPGSIWAKCDLTLALHPGNSRGWAEFGRAWQESDP